MQNTRKWKIGWGVTNKCNMRCPFCYSLVARDQKHDVGLSELVAFIDANHMFIDSINYGTGENTLSENWFELVSYIHQFYPEIKQALTTNGYLADALKSRQDADSILAALDEVDVSLDYCDEMKHSTFRGHEAAFRWAIETIEVCTSAQIETTLVVIGLDQTLKLDNLQKLFNLATEHGCFVRINIFRPNHHQKLKPLSYLILKSALEYILTDHCVVSLGDPLFSALILGQEFPDTSGRTSLRILPDGSITPSTYLVTEKWKRAHIHDMMFSASDIVEHLSAGISTNSTPNECSSCSLVQICRGGAIDRRMIWYDSMTHRDPYCPLENGDSIEYWHGFDNIRLVAGPEIHKGYLPTLIFAPSVFGD